MDIDWRLELLADVCAGADIMRCVDIYNEAMGRALGAGHWDLNMEQWIETLDGARESALWVCRSESGQVEGFSLSCMYDKGAIHCCKCWRFQRRLKAVGLESLYWRPAWNRWEVGAHPLRKLM